jgi:adenylate cyclase
LQIAERHVELNPDDARALYLGANALVRLGEPQRALDWAARAVALDPEDSGVLYNTACVRITLGDGEGALALLDQAIQNGFGDREWLENDPDLDSLRPDPRFQALPRKL